MPGKRIVNASPLVFLAREDLLEMLPQGGFDVVVPEAVLEEIRAHGLADPTVVGIGRVSWRPSPRSSSRRKSRAGTSAPASRPSWRSRGPSRGRPS